MFSSKGLFKDVPCPNQNDCCLPACWFLHRDPDSPESDPAREYDPLSAGAPESPPTKRRKLSHDEGPPQKVTTAGPLPVGVRMSTTGHGIAQLSSIVQLSPENGQNGPKRTVPEANRLSDSPKVQLRTATRHVTPPVSQKTSKPNGQTKTTKREQAGQPKDVGATKQSDAPEISSTSLKRPVSPPPTKTKPQAAAQMQTTNAKAPQPVKQEALIPRALGPGPAQLGSRINFLKALHAQIKTRNSEVFKAGEKYKLVRLVEQEMITLALDEEEEIARKHETGIYQNIVRQRAHKIKTMKLDDWAALLPGKVLRVRRLQAKKGITSLTPTPKPQQRPTGMPEEEEMAVLRRLREPLEPLQQYGYVAVRPGGAEVAAAKATVAASGNWEQCDRCASRFQVFPGRNEHGRLASGGECNYHWGRVGRQQQTRTQRIAGASEQRYSCCNQLFGSVGCTTAESHVFNVKDPKRLASIWQWEQTPEKEGTNQPLSYDCEMCYTTMGMEVVRVTAVSWPLNEPVLDILVRPFGEILDLNTRFSGVSVKAYTEAPPYGGASSNALQKVGSPAEARRMLFDLITPTTPLIGHAIDNDLNTLRIIHPFVIDTVLLYPHRAGLPKRMSLRGLAQDHLSRTIQSGEGHDSKEDAIATGDLVTLAVKNRGVVLRASGWRFEDGEFVKGEGSSKL